jgi:CDP-glucose 4,6-dehydratase
MEGLELIASGFAGTYRGRRVLVTGHTGFKGSWLSLWLRELGAEVSGLALPPPTTPSCFQLCRLEERLASSRIVDLRELAALRSAVAEARPEVVFHLAAQPLVRESYRTPRETFDTNLMGTVNLLECLRAEPSLRAVVVVTSDKCYENREWDFGYREPDPMGGHDPYSASKGCAELATAAYRRSFLAGRGVGVASARAGNVIGGGDWGEDRLIPDCVRALASDTPVLLRNPTSVRPWQHVLEPLSGYLLLGASLLQEPARFAEAWNFGPIEAGMPTVREVAERFIAAFGRGRLELARDGGDEPHEAHLLRLSCEKAASRLGWRPVLSFSDAIDWTVRWYAAWERARDASALELTREQIADYTRRASAARLPWAPRP